MTIHCNQIYIYIITIIISVLTSLSKKNITESLVVLITGSVIILALININYCDTKYTLISWTLAIFSIFVAIGNVMFMLNLNGNQIENK